jgi:hypothetical protein
VWQAAAWALLDKPAVAPDFPQQKLMKRLPPVLFAALAALALARPAAADTVTVTTPFLGVTEVVETLTLSPTQTAHVHVVEISLHAPGIGFELSPASPPSPNTCADQTSVQTTLACLNQAHAQVAVNAQFFIPYPAEPNGGTNLVGFAASDGNVYSPFSDAPAQNYAIVADAPGLNISSNNVAQIVLRGPTTRSLVAAGNPAIPVTPYNTVTGSAQIITNGRVTIPSYSSRGPLYANGTYGNGNSWYNAVKARTAVGLSEDEQTLYLFTVDAAGGSNGMTVPQVAAFLQANFHVYNALNLDGGGSTTMAMADPATGVGSVINVPSNSGGPRAVGASLVVFARPVPEPATIIMPGRRCRRWFRLVRGGLLCR